ncbi:MAG: DUF2806 domain-containing protein [Fulvivirga sp.]
MKEEDKGLLELIKSIPIPDIVKNNAITALAKGIGNIIKSASDIPVSYFNSISSEIKAKSDARIKLINSSSDEAAKLFKTDSDLANRALNYFGSRIVEEQLNRESVALKTIDNLNKKSGIESNNKKIDPDWIAQFWRLAETKTKHDVQEILANILTKEIVSPNSVSPNTLQLLTILTSDIGSAFQRLCNISIDDGQRCFVVHPNVFAFQNIGPLNDYEVTYDDLFELDGANLIRSAETLMLNYSKSDKEEYEVVDFAGQPYELDVSGKQLHLIQFTKSGRELRNLMDLTPNKEYLKSIIEKLGDAFRAKDNR